VPGGIVSASADPHPPLFVRVTTNASEVLVKAVPPATQLLMVRQLTAVKDASAAVVGAGILTVLHADVRA